MSVRVRNRVSASFQIIPRSVGQLGLALRSEPHIVGRLGSGPRVGTGGLSPGIFFIGGCLSSLSLRACVEVWFSSCRVARIIVSLYKGKGPRNNCGSYRPISLLSVPGKVFANVLIARLQPLLTARRRPQQFGFTPGRSTIDAILALRLLSELYTSGILPTSER